MMEKQLSSMFGDNLENGEFNEGEDFGYDETTCKLFKEKYGADPHSLNTSSELYRTFCQFRADFVTELVGSIREMLKKERPDMVLSAAVAPDYNSSLRAMCQDPTGWIKKGYLDEVLPMAYGSTDMVVHTIEATDKLGDMLGLYGHQC